MGKCGRRSLTEKMECHEDKLVRGFCLHQTRASRWKEQPEQRSWAGMCLIVEAGVAVRLVTL